MQDGIKIRRGRPRRYDREASLKAIMNLFWRKGYSATSLDELSEATGMGRPSLYQAFGNKEDMYVEALAFFITRMAQSAEKAFGEHQDIKEAIKQFYFRMLDIYFEDSSELGCLVFCTAVSETNNYPKIRSVLQDTIDKIGIALEHRIILAKESGQLREDVDHKAKAILAQAILQHLAIRARAGESKQSLYNVVDVTLHALFA
jgi:TetR/AcrR family transcriptional regulator, copper-responsive repressor